MKCLISFKITKRLCYFPYTNKISWQRILLASCYWANWASIHQTWNKVKANMSKHDNKHLKHVSNNKKVDLREKINCQNNYICVRQFSIRSKVYLYHLSKRGGRIWTKQNIFHSIILCLTFPQTLCMHKLVEVFIVRLLRSANRRLLADR